MTDLSKAEYIRHDLLFSKLETYGPGEKALSYIYSSLKNRNPLIRINVTIIDFQKIISSVPRGCITGLILFFNGIFVRFCLKLIRRGKGFAIIGQGVDFSELLTARIKGKERESFCKFLINAGGLVATARQGLKHRSENL